MSDAKVIPFCPDLQLPWSLVRLECRDLREVEVIVGAGRRDARPETLGRPAADVLSYPTIFTQQGEATFRFRQCLSFRILDEMAESLYGEKEPGDGKTFVRFLSSKILQQYRNGLPAGSPLFHYRLVFQSEIIDVVCRETPEIAKRFPAPGI
jgi:hypothetical protein